MRFLVDENLPRSLARTLRDLGLQTDHVLDLNMGGQADSLVAAWAADRRAVIVTRDRDFIGSKIATICPAVVWIRVGNMTSKEISTRCGAVWPGVLGALEAGERVVEVR